MTRSEPELLIDVTCEIAEGPLWHPDENRLYWADIPSGDLYRYDPATGDHEHIYASDEPIGGYTFQTDGTLLLFQDRGAVRHLDQYNDLVTTVVEPDPDRFDARFNDVIADPEGRVFAGVMPDTERGIPGGLYRLDADRTLETIREDCSLPNGMGFTPDLSGLYFVDNGEPDPDHPGSIYRYDYDRATGAITDPEVVVDGTDIEGLFDGMTVDAAGHVWSAFWNGHKLMRFAPDGTPERTVEFPVRKVSSLTFGGHGYDTAYVTTANLEGRAVEGEGAGGVFEVDLGVVGREEFRSDVPTRSIV